MPYALFQSHNGAIAAPFRHPKFPVDHRFQSHNGAIAANDGVWLKVTYTGFQSHNGAIAAFPFPVLPVLTSAVSIPQWCDCCTFEDVVQAIVELGFNPTMVRLLRR